MAGWRSQKCIPFAGLFYKGNIPFLGLFVQENVYFDGPFVQENIHFRKPFLISIHHFVGLFEKCISFMELALIQLYPWAT